MGLLPGLNYVSDTACVLAASGKHARLLRDDWLQFLPLSLLQGLGCRQQVWVAELYAEGGSSEAGPKP